MTKCEFFDLNRPKVSNNRPNCTQGTWTDDLQANHQSIMLSPAKQYGISGWFWYDSVMPAVQSTLRYNRMFRLSQTSNGGDASKFGDQTLAAFFINDYLNENKKFIEFGTYNDQVSPNVRFSSPAEPIEKFEKKWTFVYMAYDEYLKEITCYIKYSDGCSYQHIEGNITHLNMSTNFESCANDDFYKGYNGEVSGIRFFRDLYSSDPASIEKNYMLPMPAAPLIYSGQCLSTCKAGFWPNSTPSGHCQQCTVNDNSNANQKWCNPTILNQNSNVTSIATQGGPQAEGGGWFKWWYLLFLLIPLLCCVGLLIWCCKKKKNKAKTAIPQLQQMRKPPVKQQKQLRVAEVNSFTSAQKIQPTENEVMGGVQGSEQNKKDSQYEDEEDNAENVEDEDYYDYQMRKPFKGGHEGGDNDGPVPPLGLRQYDFYCLGFVEDVNDIVTWQRNLDMVGGFR